MLAPEAVKPFILHSEQIVRQFAVSYFHESFSKDPELMTLVLESCRRYPENESKLRLLANSYEFSQNTESIQTIMKFISEDPQNRDYYEQILTNCNLNVLQELDFDLKSLLSYTQKVLEQRYKAASRSTLELWEDLLKHSAEAATVDPTLYDFNYGVILVKELALRPDFSVAKILEQLKFPYGPSYKGYDEIYLCMLAGEVGLSEAIPLLLKHLGNPETFLAQGAKEALIKIGTEEVLQGLANRYQAEEGPLRVVFADVFGHIKLNLSEKLALDLLETTLISLSDKKPIDVEVSSNEEGSIEEEGSLESINSSAATNLAKSLCNLLSVDGIPLVQRLIAKGYDPEITMLEENLYTCCRITGVELPELERYNRLIEEEKIRFRQAKMRTFMLFNKNAKINRNDPCPCGSGKKYKKCCGK